MQVDHYRDLRPDDTRAVEVQADGNWFYGDLEAVRRRDGRWEGWVRWTVYRDGMPGQHIGWFDQECIRGFDEHAWLQ